MQSNIPKLYLANFLTGIVFWYAVEKLFMPTIGIDAFGVAINAVVYVSVALVLQVPAGILADKWSRRYTIVLGLLFLTVCDVILGFSHNFTQYLVGTIFYGFYNVMTEGTFQALTYDSLLAAHRSQQYTKHQGRSYGMFLLGVSLSAVFGGYLGNWLGFRATFFLSIIPALLAAGVVLSMQEPMVHKADETTKLLHHAWQAVRLLAQTSLLRYLSLFFIGAIIISNAQNEFPSLYYIALGFGAVGNGWATAGKWLSSSIGHFMAARLTHVMPWLVPVFFMTAIGFTFWHAPLGLIIFYIASFIDSVLTTNTEAIIQDHTPSSIRATTLSVITFASSGVLIPANLVFGIFARSNIFHAYLFTGVLGLLFGLAWYLRPHSTKLQVKDVGLPVGTRAL